MKKTMTVVLLAGLLPLAALAQYGSPGPKAVGPGTPGAPAADATAAAAGPVDATDTATAPPTCKKPLLPSSVRRADDASEFNDKFNAYQTCIKAYVDLQGKLATQHINAGNKAVEDANAFVNETNAKLAK